MPANSLRFWSWFISCVLQPTRNGFSKRSTKPKPGKWNAFRASNSLSRPTVPKYRAEYSAAFTEDYLYWTRTDQAVASRIDRLMLAIEQNPFSGVGKPEPLRWGPFKAAWSRRITREHRLIYKVEKNTITYLQCRYHY